MKTMYRGVRMKEHDLQLLKSEGMRYYWKDPEQSINAIFRALEDNHKVKKLGTEPHLRSFISEGSRINRIQMWATDDKKNANSYARWTPELIFLALDWCGISRKDTQKYLNKTFGTPYVVTFELEMENPAGFYNNHTIGDFISAIHIMDIEEVDLNSKDPLYDSWSQVVS